MPRMTKALPIKRFTTLSTRPPSRYVPRPERQKTGESTYLSHSLRQRTWGDSPTCEKSRCHRTDDSLSANESGVTTTSSEDIGSSPPRISLSVKDTASVIEPPPAWSRRKSASACPTRRSQLSSHLHDRIGVSRGVRPEDFQLDILQGSHGRFSSLGVLLAGTHHSSCHRLCWQH